MSDADEGTTDEGRPPPHAPYCLCVCGPSTIAAPAARPETDEPLRREVERLCDEAVREDFRAWPGVSVDDLRAALAAAPDRAGTDTGLAHWNAEHPAVTPVSATAGRDALREALGRVRALINMHHDDDITDEGETFVTTRELLAALDGLPDDTERDVR